jgi:hypothetical protein
MTVEATERSPMDWGGGGDARGSLPPTLCTAVWSMLAGPHQLGVNGMARRLEGNVGEYCGGGSVGAGGRYGVDRATAMFPKRGSAK